MADILLRRDSDHAVTPVPNTFIDECMTQANGEFVKIYLYLLRCMSHPGAPFSISATADKFNQTERDVKRALRYWERLHLLQLEFDEQEELTGICLSDLAAVPAADKPSVKIAGDLAGTPPTQPEPSDESASFPAGSVQPQSDVKLPARRSYNRQELMQFSEDESLKELFFIAERYMGHPLNNNETQTILFWFDQLALSAELIEYLMESCIEKGHKSVRYMDTIALDWAKQDIHDLAHAKQERDTHSRPVHTVMKAFGISGRNLVDYELQFVKKWFDTMAFSPDIIACACQRTIRSAHQISFEYADSILTSWKKQNVRTLKDIQLLDAEYQETQKAQRTENYVRTATGTKVNRFNSIHSRSYDYDKLERELLTR